MTTHITKTWFDGKNIVTQEIPVEEGMKQERALWELSKLGQEIEAQPKQLAAHREGFWCADLTCKKCYSADFRFKQKNSVVNESLTTPAQRPWVGLTDEEVRKICVDEWGGYEQVRAIEAKLKEKNT